MMTPNAGRFVDQLRETINRHSMENGSNTPDFILASFLMDCVISWECATKARDDWYGISPHLGEERPSRGTPAPALDETRKDAEIYLRHITEAWEALEDAGVKNPNGDTLAEVIARALQKRAPALDEQTIRKDERDRCAQVATSYVRKRAPDADDQYGMGITNCAVSIERDIRELP